MATKLAFTDRELLQRFRETYRELSIYQMADIDEDEFVERYAEALKCDPWQAWRVHRAAAQIKEQVAYFVDLMRFAETNITLKIPANVSTDLKLELQRLLTERTKRKG